MLAFFMFFLFLSPSYAADPPPIKIVASFSILGDMIRQIGGKLVDLKVLAGPGRDPHHFEAAPENAKDLAQAEIIAVNGLDFEGWIGRLISASGTNADLLVASAGITPRMIDKEIVDPHAWQDLKNGEVYARNIAGALIGARPEKAEEIKQRARAYIAKIKKLDQKIRTVFAALPEENRKIITGHDAFGYFGRAYGLQFIAPVGISTQEEPSADHIAALIEQIKREQIKILFVENLTSPRLIQQIAQDTGARVGRELYTGALSDKDGPAPTYLEMMRYNADVLLDSMKR
jgi:zinc/manganese transport system substrate-binding protein